jgi:outer membrane lipoprotein
LLFPTSVSNEILQFRKQAIFYRYLDWHTVGDVLSSSKVRFIQGSIMKNKAIPESCMKALGIVITAVSVLILMACAVVPKPLPDQALPPLPFPEIVASAAKYIDKTGTFGGSVLEVTNGNGQTQLEALQVPLGVGQKPKDKDLSQGRLILIYAGFLDPEIYTKGRLVTVSGKLLGSSATESGDKPYPYLRIEVTELHLWPIAQPIQPEPYYWEPFWYPYPWPWWRYSPHHWHD